MTDIDKRARVSSVYNIFAYFIYIPLIMILPRLVQSLHPGGMEGAKGGGNPALGGGSLDATMRNGFLACSFWLDAFRNMDQQFKNKIELACQ